MPRTTIDLDASVLRELKRRQRADGRSLGKLASELLAAALARNQGGTQPAFRWVATSMGSRIDVEDKEALRRALDEG